MRSTMLLPLLALIVTSFSSPISLGERTSGTLQIIQADALAVISTINSDLSTIRTAVKSSASDVTSQVQLIAIIIASANDIKSQFQNAAVSMKASTVGLATSLTAPEIMALIFTTNNMNTLAWTLAADYQSMKTQLSADTFAAVKSEYAAAASAVKPFAGPLMAYSKSVQLIGQDGAGTGLTALLGAVSGLGATIGLLLASVGI